MINQKLSIFISIIIINFMLCSNSNEIGYKSLSKDSIMFVAFIDTVLYVSSKYNVNKDIIWKFRNCMTNNLWTLDSVGTVENIDNLPTENVRQNMTMLMTSKIGDCVTMPYSIGDPVTFEYWWMGGNHLMNGYKTAKTTDKHIFADDTEIFSGFSGYVSKVNFLTENELFRADNHPQKPINKIASEMVEIDIKNNSLECFVTTKMDSAYIILSYYGNAITQNNTWHDSLYFAFSNNNDLMIDAKSCIVDSCGNYIDYPLADRAIVFNINKDLSCELRLDINYGVVSNPDKYLGSQNDSRFFIFSTNKIYSHVIRNYRSTENEFFEFKSSYTFKDMSDFDSIIIPKRPQNLNIQNDSNSVFLSWDPVDRAKSYKIYGSDNPYKEFILLDLTNENFWSYTISNQDNKKYFIVIASTESI